MIRPILVLATLAALVAAGCIAPSQPQPSTTPTPPSPQDRVQGMTADVQKTDKAVDCSQGTSVPPEFCAERNLTVTGRIGVDSLPVQLMATNGGAVVRAGEGDAWSFHAVVRVSAPTQDMANQGLDTAWTWSHESGGKHALQAGPAQALATPLPIGTGVGAAQVVSTRYELTLPAWVTLETLGVKGDNGAISVSGFRAGKVDLSTENGQIVFSGSAADATMKTSNGQIVMDIEPTATGKIAVSTSNGEIVGTLRQAAGQGVDADGKSGNGLVSLTLSGGQLTANERNHKHFRSDGFDSAAIQTTIAMTTDNGLIHLQGQ